MPSNAPSSHNTNPAKDKTRANIDKMEAERLARREAQQRAKLDRANEERRNLAMGNPGDVDFIGLVRKWRAAPPDGVAECERVRDDSMFDFDFDMSEAKVAKGSKICIVVRKRPVSDKERNKQVSFS